VIAPVCIRVEQPGDVPHIRDIAAHAFGQRTEADLIDRLRADGAVLVSLVAVTDRGELVGHILFSRLRIDRGGGRVAEAAALAPLAVRPEHQRQGIGSALIQAGITACDARGLGGVVVLGHPRLYRRFGFSPATARDLHAPFSGDAFMALELRPGILVGSPAVARYADAFNAVPAEDQS
jgi:putative acetyltransferase